MKLVVGLGNPGGKYQNNRHNVGHLFVQSQKSKVKSQNDNAKIKILETDCFMNDSGKFVDGVTCHLSLVTGKDLYIVHDDLDLKLGSYKIQFGVGPKVHYGVQSIENELGTKGFWRVRIGVDSRYPNNRAPGEDYILQDFTREERAVLEDLFPKIWEELVSRLL